MGAIGVVTDFVTGASWEDFPPEVQQKSVACFLDSLGAALVGTKTRVAQIAEDFAAHQLSGESATILGSARTASAMGAAFANAVAANGTDIDDCGIHTGGHPGAQVLPTALALAESLHRPGRDFLTAMVVGYEVAFRAGRCVLAHSRSSERRGYRACGSWGSLATAAIAAYLLGLSPAQTEQALGIAEYHAPDLPLMRDLDHPAMVKHGMGIGPLTGIMAAQLASAGFTGIPSILGFDEYAGWVEDLGRTYLLPTGIAWKRFSCCAWVHPALVAVQRLTAASSIPLGQIARVRVVAYEEACRLGTRMPETTEEAQFNMAWPIACLLRHGEVRPEHVLEANLADPETRRLAGLVELEESREFTRLYDLSEARDPVGRELAEVAVELSDGGSLASGPVQFPVYEDWPIEDVEEKFRWVMRETVPREEVEALIEGVRAFEKVDDVADFVGKLLAVRLSNRVSLID